MSNSDSQSTSRISTEDIWTLNRLRLSPNCTEQLLDDLVAWWHEVSPSHNLLSFLAIQGVISLDSAQIWGEAAEGTSEARELAESFSNRHILTLREKLAMRQQAELQTPSSISSMFNSSTFAANIQRYATEHHQAESESPDGTHFPAVGDTLGKCTLTHKLGSGGTCQVFAALHRTLNVTVAVKVLSIRHKRKSAVDNDLFRREAQLLARLNDSRIVRILDFEDKNPPYLILEFVDGLSVSELIDRSGSIDPDQAARIIQQTSKALRYAHGWNVIHRDIKPANILLDREGHVKLADLGMAALTAQLRKETNGEHANSVCGTPAYVAPEVIINPNAASVQSDVYSLGVTLYHMLTGDYPFKARTVETMLLAHLKEKPLAPRAIHSNISKYLSNLTLAMMEKKPENRPASMEEVQEGLDTVLSMHDHGAQDATMTTRIRRRLYAMLRGDG